MLCGLGLLASGIGIYLCKIEGEDGTPTKALNLSTYTATGIYLVLTALATLIFGFSWKYWAQRLSALWLALL